MRLWKLTDQDLRTYGGHQWRVGEPFETDGRGALCGPGFIHAYTHPALALFLNPIHANFYPATMRLWRAEGTIAKTDHDLKVGCTRLMLLEEVTPLPTFTIECRITFALLCTLAVYQEPTWVTWAEGWLSGSNRSRTAWARARALAAAAVVTKAAGQEAMAAEAARAAAWAAAWGPRAARTRLAAVAAEVAARAWMVDRICHFNLIEMAEAATLPLEWPT